MSKKATVAAGVTQENGNVGGFNPDTHVVKLENTSEKDMMYDFGKNQVEKFLAAVNEGKLPCQPLENTKDGSYGDTYPARNVIWDNTYHGINQFLLKIEQREKGYKTGDYLTTDAAKKAYDFYSKKHGIPLEGVPVLKKDAEPIVIMVADKGVPKFIPLYNIDSFGEPQAIREFAGHLREQKQERLKEYRESRGEKYYKPSPKSRDNGVVVCKSTDPVAFLGQWEAACSTGKGFKVTPEQNAAFTKVCNEYINQPMDNGQQNRPYRLVKLMDEAGKYCKTFIPTLFQKKESPERTITAPEPEMGR